MILRLTLLVIAACLTLIVALTMLVSRQVRIMTRAAFVAVCLSLSLWQINIFIADHLDSYLLLANTILFFWPTAAVYSSGLFLASLTSSKTGDGLFRHDRYIAGISILTALQALAVISGQVLTEATKLSSGTLEVGRGNLYAFYVVALILTMTWQLLWLSRALKKRSSVQENRALRVVFRTMLVTIVYGVITNIVIPVATGSQKLIALGVFSIVIYSFGLAYGVVRYQFLNIRLIVARTVAYLLSMSMIALLFGLILYLLSGLIGRLSESEIVVSFAYVLASVLLAIQFTNLKMFFDRVTSKVFFRNDYDSQELLDKISNEVTKEYELERLTRSSLQLIQSNMNAEEAAIGIIRDKKKVELHIYPSNRIGLKKDELHEFIELLDAEPKKIVNPYKALQPRLRQILAKHHIEIAELLQIGNENIGFMYLTSKKHGGAYSRKDEKVIDIITDELAVAIQNALRFDEIQKFSETLQEEVEDATRRLRYSNDKLRALDETKDEFISMASHQLRTPLTSVKGYLSMVLDGDVGELNDQQKKMLTQAFTSSQHMNYLITDLLNVSRLRTGKFVIEKKPVDLAKVIDEEISQLKAIARAKKITLNFEKPNNFPILELDETKTRQVIMNFIDNALHYTPDGGEVTVSLEVKRKSVELKVIDNGLGVPKSEQHKLFGKFFRADNARRARPDGTGLGLFMAKKVVIAQGGAIIFKSQEGKGSTFGFTFPVSGT